MYVITGPVFTEGSPRIGNNGVIRYAKKLEKQLGGPEQVAAALDTMTNLEESPPEVVSPGDLTLLKAWGKASVAAKQAGFRDLGEGEGAYFEVRLV